MLVADVMDAAPAEVQNRATFREAAKLFVSEGTSDLVVRDGERYVGVLSEGDLLRALIPDFERDTMSVAGVSLQEAADLFLKSGSFNADRSIASLVLTRPISLSPSDTLLKAATVMANDHIRRLPVLDGGDLVGMLSRAKLSVALLTQSEPVA